MVLNFFYMFLGLAITKAVIEPAATAYGRRKIQKYGPKVYEYIDKVLPFVFGELDGNELEAKFYDDIEAITDQEWRPSKKEMDIILKEHDLRANATRLKTESKKAG